MSHTFTIQLRGVQGLQGAITPDAVPVSVPFAVPKEFGGPGGQWTPEHFLAAAVSSCITATFLSIAQQSKFAFAAYEATASATMAKTAEGFRVTRVEVSPRITVRSEADREKADRMIRKAESFCPISRSLNVEVHLEPVIVVAA
jgi:peroxiredoxin-like protein